MTAFITKEKYTNIVSTFQGIAEESRTLMLNEKFGEEFAKNIREGIEELEGKSPEELKEVFDNARAEAREVFSGPDAETIKVDMRDGLKAELDIEFDGDIEQFVYDCTEIIIAVIAEMLGIA